MVGMAASTSTPAEAGATTIPSRLRDDFVCDLSEKEIEDGCSRYKAKVGHEVKVEGTARRLSTIARGGSDPTDKELGQCVANKIYWAIMDLFCLRARQLAYHGFGRNWEYPS